jgi:hypothetical protein
MRRLKLVCMIFTMNDHNLLGRSFSYAFLMPDFLTVLPSPSFSDLNIPFTLLLAFESHREGSFQNLKVAVLRLDCSLAPAVDADDKDCEWADVDPVSLWAVSALPDTVDGGVVVVELGFDEVVVGRVEVEACGVGLAVDGLSAVEPVSGVDGCREVLTEFGWLTILEGNQER